MAGPTGISQTQSPAPPYEEYSKPSPLNNDSTPIPAHTENPQQAPPNQSQVPFQGSIPQNAYVTPLERLADQPEEVDCPFCKRRALTRMQKEDSSMTIVAGGLLCLFCICLTCLPCILGWAQNIDHYCSQCGKQLTHRPHDGTTVVTEDAKAVRAGNGPVGPKHGQVASQYGAAQPQQDHGIQANPQTVSQASPEKVG